LNQSVGVVTHKLLGMLTLFNSRPKCSTESKHIHVLLHLTSKFGDFQSCSDTSRSLCTST